MKETFYESFDYEKINSVNKSNAKNNHDNKILDKNLIMNEPDYNIKKRQN